MMAEYPHRLKNGVWLSDADGPLKIGIAYVNKKFHGQLLHWVDG